MDFCILKIYLSDEVIISLIPVLNTLLTLLQLLNLLQLCLILLLEELDGYFFLVLASGGYGHLIIVVFGKLRRLRHDARPLTDVVTGFFAQVLCLEGGQLDLFDPIFFFLFFDLGFKRLNVLVSFGEFPATLHEPLVLFFKLFDGEA